MSDAVAVHGHGPAGEVTRRDSLTLVTGAAAAVGAAGSVWPMIDSMNPAQDVPKAQLSDLPSDSARVKPNHAEWIGLIGVCTHPGRVPLGTKATDPRGDDRGSWFYPCHGGHYDTSGRVRHGPAPANLAVPGYAFDSDSKIKIG